MPSNTSRNSRKYPQYSFSLRPPRQEKEREKKERERQREREEEEGGKRKREGRRRGRRRRKKRKYINRQGDRERERERGTISRRRNMVRVMWYILLNVHVVFVSELASARPMWSSNRIIVQIQWNTYTHTWMNVNTYMELVLIMCLNNTCESLRTIVLDLTFRLTAIFCFTPFLVHVTHGHDDDDLDDDDRTYLYLTTSSSSTHFLRRS